MPTVLNQIVNLALNTNFDATQHPISNHSDVISGSSMDSENYLEVLSDSDGSPANEPDSDSSYTMGSESSDEDFTPAGPSIPKNRNASKQASGVESIEQLCPPSSSRKSEFEISDELYAIICRKQANGIPNHWRLDSIRIKAKES